MKTFILHWFGGRSEIVKGHDIADTFRRAGYGGGAIHALDYYEECNKELAEALDESFSQED